MSFGPDGARQVLIDPAQFSQDWKVNVSTIVTPASNSVLAAPANPRRICLLIGQVATANFKVGTHNFDTDQEFLLMGSNTPGNMFKLNYSIDGGLTCVDWWVASGSGIAIRLTIIETIWLPLGG